MTRALFAIESIDFDMAENTHQHRRRHATPRNKLGAWMRALFSQNFNEIIIE